MLTTPKFIFLAWICLLDTRLMYQVAHLTATLGCVKHLNLDISQHKFFIYDPSYSPRNQKQSKIVCLQSFPSENDNSVLPSAQAKNVIVALRAFLSFSLYIQSSG